MIIITANNIIRRMNYNDPMDRQDCLQEALFMTFKNIYSFEEEKYKLALPFTTELIKRGLSKGWNQLHEKDIQKVRNLIHL